MALENYMSYEPVRQPVSYGPIGLVFRGVGGPKGSLTHGIVRSGWEFIKNKFTMEESMVGSY